MSKVLTLEDLVVDCSAGKNFNVQRAFEKKMHRNRAALLRNTGMEELSEMAEWARFIDVTQMEYRYGTGFRNAMGNGVLSVGTEPHFTNIDPHNEMAYWKFYPKCILFGCEKIPASGGDTVIADNVRVTRDLAQTKTGRKIREKGIRYIRNFSDRDRSECIPSMKHWQDNFDLENWQELEDYCEDMEWKLVKRPDGSVQVSYPETGYEFDPVSGVNLLFTSMARLGRAFDNWPPYDALPLEQRPYHLTYADHSEFSDQDLATLDKIFARYSIPIRWRPGDIAVLENIAWTHARPPYELNEGETRSIGVLVGEPVDRKRIVDTARIA